MPAWRGAGDGVEAAAVLVNLAAQDRVLVPENQKLCILGHLPLGQHHQTIKQAAYEQADDRNDHSEMIPGRSSTPSQSVNRAPQDAEPAVKLPRPILEV